MLVGGSGLYVQAVLDELEFPGTDPALRAELEAELADRGPEALHARLAALDPAAAAAVLPGNGRRDRARAGGDRADRAAVPGPAAHRRPAAATTRVLIGVDRDTAELDRRIARRVARMFAAGLVDGDPRAAARGLRDGRTASRALGYQQVLAALDGAGEPAPTPRRTRSGPPAGSSAGSAPGSAATAGSTGWTARRPRTCSAGPRPSWPSAAARP